jgi:hypothetical protein
MDEITKLAAKCRVATPHNVVTNSECVYTFHSPYTTDRGIVVNLTTFVGTIDELALASDAEDEPPPASSALFVRIRKERVLKENANGEGSEKLEKTAVKLGVGVEGGFQSDHEKYDTVSTYSIVAIGKGANDGEDGKVRVLAEIPYDDGSKQSFPMVVSRSADAVICHAGLAVKQDLTAWELDEEPKPVSRYAVSLPFVDNGVKISPNPSDWTVRYSQSRIIVCLVHKLTYGTMITYMCSLLPRRSPV